ncbi:hypothetical protein [Kitasatospora sp. NPDC017646]|uniref:hypothetical protein n=1 Tax=Kitasatospora sp. NPDC017646 TaxID=3364024 RepID=UPI0037AE8F4E
MPANDDVLRADGSFDTARARVAPPLAEAAAWTGPVARPGESPAAPGLDPTLEVDPRRRPDTGG